MKKLLQIVYWVVSVLVVIFLIGLGLKIAKVLIGVLVLAGIGVVLYVLFGPNKKSGPG